MGVLVRVAAVTSVSRVSRGFYSMMRTIILEIYKGRTHRC